MGIYSTPWRCPDCDNTWFRTEQHLRIAKNKFKMIPGMHPLPYEEPGEVGTKLVAVCTECGRILKELYID